MKKTLDSVVHDFDLIHCKLPPKEEFYSWLFEYACQTAEYEGKQPQKVYKYLEFLMIEKAKDMYECSRLCYNEGAISMTLSLPRRKDIPYIVKMEHKKPKGYLK